MMWREGERGFDFEPKLQVGRVRLSRFPVSTKKSKDDAGPGQVPVVQAARVAAVNRGGKHDRD